MNLYERLHKPPAEGPKEAPPAGGIRRWFFLLKTHFWKLVGVNLLFVAFSLPIVTLPAALCGMNRVLCKLIRDGNCFVWDEFFGEFKSALWKALPTGALFAALLAASYYLLRLAESNHGSLYGLLFGALGILLLVAEAAASGYTFAMLPLVSLSMQDVLNNSYRLAFVSGKRTLGMLGIKLVMAILLLSLFPASIALWLLLWPAFTQFSVCSLLYPAICKYVIRPAPEAEPPCTDA